MKVEDVMTAPVVTVGPKVPLKEVAAILADKGISGVPVVDEGGELVGVVSETDILYKEAAETSRAGRFSSLLHPHAEADPKQAARTAGEAMTSPALTIEASLPLSEAARLMINEGVNRLPVLAGGNLVGIVTRADLVRAFVRPDREIEHEIREDAALRSHGIDPNALSVVVEGGIVRIGGLVDAEADAELVVQLVGRIPGVVSVDSRLVSRSA